MIKSALPLLTLLITSFVHAQITYPSTKKVAQVDNYHGTVVEDPYRWLENDTSAETKAWVAEENKVTNKYLEKIPFRDELRKRIADLYNYARYGTPFRKGEYFYYYKNNGLQNQSVLYRQKGLNGKEETVIDPNTLSKDGTTQLADFTLSKDGKYAAWGISRGGSDWQTFYIKDMTTMKNLPDSLNWVKVSDIAWYKKGFYYSRYPAPGAGQELSSKNENHQVWYHAVGTSQDKDQLVYEDSLNPQRFHTVYIDDDEKYLFLTISDRGKGLRGNALFFMNMRDNNKVFKPIIKEVGEYLYDVVGLTNDGKILLETNREAKNKKIVLVDPASPAIGNWKEIIAEKKEPLESSDMAGGKIFARYLADVSSKVYVYNTDGKQIGEVKLPGLGAASGFKGLKDDKFTFYAFTSFNFPTTIYKYDIATGKSTVFRKPAITFNPEDFITTQEFYKSKDGTTVPMFIVHKKGITKNGQNPTLLYGYGGFNINITPSFITTLIPFLEKGGIFAVASLRGGAEYGEKWHEAGMLEKKQNVFDDFIAAAEYLVQSKYTSSNKLAIRGGSNGGLLVGAVINQRPDLFKVAIPEVGVMDMLRFHKFTIGWNWIAEYGSSDNEKDFKYLYAYSPLHNIKAGLNYPATLIITADHDDRVVPAHSFKYAATLQEKYKGNNPILIRIDTNSGHGSSSIKKNIDLAADIYSFILYNLE